jgi:hypothetical protein
MIFDVIASVAQADTIAPGEQLILDSLRQAWSIAD